LETVKELFFKPYFSQTKVPQTRGEKFLIMFGILSLSGKLNTVGARNFKLQELVQY
jgi:hypothetical protein